MNDLKIGTILLTFFIYPFVCYRQTPGYHVFCETQWRLSVKTRLYNTPPPPYFILWFSATSLGENKVMWDPSLILHCISQLGENKGGQGHWVSQNMWYEFRTPLLPGEFSQPKQSDLIVTSTLQSVNRWRHNGYSCWSHPSFSYRLHIHRSVVKVRLVDWRSDLIGQDAY